MKEKQTRKPPAPNTPRYHSGHEEVLPKTDGVAPTTLANKEKSQAALTSVLAAIFLTGMKLVVGVITGSLGILAEAAHSGLDLVAAVMTLVAVRVSGRPADPTHTYGHGKIENLSAMFETGLLLVTCVWIIYEALRRLFFKEVAVEANIWSFIVMAASIIIDASRSKILSRAAKKYHSQALEADALHFSTDIWSSSVVILGLIFVWLSKTLQIPWFSKADAIAALGVSAIVIYVSVKLGRKTIQGLLDGVPASLREKVVHAASVPGVLEVKQARIRRGGPDVFVDLVLTVNREATFEYTHEISTGVEAAVREALNAPRTDVVVHVEPSTAEGNGTLALIRSLAARHNLAAHSIYLYDTQDQPTLELHLEIDETLQVSEAHDKATAFEETLRQALPQIQRIVTHLEPGGEPGAIEPVTPAEREDIQQMVARVGKKLGIDCNPHDVQIEEIAGKLSLSFHCTIDAATNLAEAHRFTEAFEQNLHRRLPNLERVVIHVEPPEPQDGKT
jgi:cation diffusion facilitator family transporter